MAKRKKKKKKGSRHVSAMYATGDAVNRMPSFWFVFSFFSVVFFLVMMGSGEFDVVTSAVGSILSAAVFGAIGHIGRI